MKNKKYTRRSKPLKKGNIITTHSIQHFSLIYALIMHLNNSFIFVNFFLKKKYICENYEQTILK